MKGVSGKHGNGLGSNEGRRGSRDGSIYLGMRLSAWRCPMHLQTKNYDVYIFI